MELTTQKELNQGVEAVKVSDPSQIEEILMELLFVPNKALKPKIVSEIVSYYERKTDSPKEEIQMFLALRDGIKKGFVFCQIDQDYRSYGKRCPTFGWLHAHNFEACKALMKECEKFVKENNFRKIRGPINYPKKVGGLGYQTEGFSAPMMNGVAYNDPGSNVLAYLKELGYKIDTKYSCVYVGVGIWEKGKQLSDDIMIRYLTLDEIKAIKDQILNLGQQSFYSVLPDAVGGPSRFDEMMDTFYQAGKKTKILNPNFDPQTFADMPSFIETWEAADLEKVVSTCIFAFDRSSSELVGLLMTLPNLFQLWAGEPLTHMNGDTIIIKKEYAGKGIFSALHTIGRSLSSAVYGYNYFEGTTIWANNDRAIKSIFPHSSPLRTHYVVQKRILRK